MEKYTEDGGVKKVIDKSVISGMACVVEIVLIVFNLVITNLKEKMMAACIITTILCAICLVIAFILFLKKRGVLAIGIAVATLVAQLILLTAGLYCEESDDDTKYLGDQMDTTGITSGATLSESTQPSTDAPSQTDVGTPIPTETMEPAIQPSIEIRFSSSGGGVAKFNAVTVPEDIAVNWQSMDDTIAAVDQEGRVSALSEGSVAIVASITFGGKVYSDEVTVTVTSETQVNKEGVARYFKSLPAGIDTEHSDFQNVFANEHIYPSQSNALQAVGLSDDTAVCADEKLVGYVYYHWCRGERIAETESHNRTSGATRDWHYSELLQKNVWCDSFSCFFSDVYLSENDMSFAADNSGSMWFENYAVCNDSYWYWPTPIYECEYEVFQTRLNVDWKK